MLTHIPVPLLPAPPSWFPGHMLQFQRMLPGLLNKTDVVLELRDARLPLTSINRNFEGACVPPFLCLSSLGSLGSFCDAWWGRRGLVSGRVGWAAGVV